MTSQISNLNKIFKKCSDEINKCIDFMAVSLSFFDSSISKSRSLFGFSLTEFSFVSGTSKVKMKLRFLARSTKITE